MRKALYAVILAVVSVGCQPKVWIFTAQPSSAAAGPVNVELNWKIRWGGGDLSSDQPVKPSLNPKLPVDPEGSKTFEVCKTTTFTLEPRYGGDSRKVTVNVAKACDAPEPCGNQVLTFMGTCPSAGQGPSYPVQTVSSGAPGNLQNLISDADFPVHVLHGGFDIALGAGGGPIGALPNVAAAGDYQIYVPGQLGIDICKEATSPVGGGQADAPVVHLTVVPACPKP
jgi:hypothetical protein